MNLVIVESPSKSHTIGKYLGNDYKVVASQGHIRDLATSGKYGLGVDVENEFAPNYIPIPGKKKIISELKKDCKEADKVYLASDPDREGEAISWHLKDTMKLKDKDYERVVFNEITKPAVIEAFKHPRKIDDDMVKSQEARRILDRIIGFRLSKLMQSKTGGKSAGRVQSVALKLIVDREDEINAFIPEEYHTITAYFDDFDAELFQYDNKDIKINTKDEADKILASLDNNFKVIDVTKKDRLRKAKAPYTTSTLQQDASNKLGFSGKKTMSIAQKLYEGINLGPETTGLITYMRTDSIRLSDEFVKASYKLINDKYGKEYVGYVKHSKKTENIQDAHEAIRPTDAFRVPSDIKEYLTADEYKLYKLIYTRALASLFSDSKSLTTTVILDDNNYQFKTTGSVIMFDGYLKIYQDFDDTEDKVLPLLEKDKVYTAKNVIEEEHFTKPKPRYTEAKLIKELEELGIGRPSTYVKIIDTLKMRDYVTVVEKKFVPTEVGITTTRRLQEFFSNLINVKYTADMEDDLDKIAEGKLIWNKLLDEFYKKFEPEVEKAFSDMEKEAPKETGEVCPECGSPLVIRKGRYGEFTACSNYPTCKYIKREEKEAQKEIIKCPNCDGMIVERKTRKGKIFYGCNNYPKCKTAFWDEPIDDKCPNCNEILVKTNKGIIKCSKCEYTKEN